MSEDKQQMITAADAIERAAQALGRAYVEYDTAYRSVSRRAYSNGNEQLTLEQTVGRATLNSLLVRRLRAVGLGPMLDAARTTGTIEDLAGELRPKIAAHVA